MAQKVEEAPEMEGQAQQKEQGFGLQLRHLWPDEGSALQPLHAWQQLHYVLLHGDCGAHGECGYVLNETGHVKQGERSLGLQLLHPLPDTSLTLHAHRACQQLLCVLLLKDYILHDERVYVQNGAGLVQQDGQGLGLKLLHLLPDTGEALYDHHAWQQLLCVLPQGICGFHGKFGYVQIEAEQAQQGEQNLDLQLLSPVT